MTLCLFALYTLALNPYRSFVVQIPSNTLVSLTLGGGPKCDLSPLHPNPQLGTLENLVGNMTTSLSTSYLGSSSLKRKRPEELIALFKRLVDPYDESSLGSCLP